MAIKVGSFAVSTGVAGTQVSITDVGFKPSLVLFWPVNTIGDAIAANNHSGGFGMAVSASDRRCVSGYQANGAGISQTSSAHDDTCAFKLMDGVGTTDGRADLVSMDATGFTYEIDEAFTSAWRIFYMAISNLTNVKGGVLTESAAGTQATTGLGFKPNGIIFASASISAAPPGTRNDFTQMVGFTSGATAARNAVVTAHDQHNQNTTVTRSYGFKGECVGLMQSNGDISGRALLSSFDTDGFTLNWLEGNSGAESNRRVLYVAFVANNVFVDSFQSQTNTTPFSETGVGFVPQGLLTLSHLHVTSTQDSVQTDQEISIGGASGALERGSVGSRSDNGSGTSDVATFSSDDAIYGNVNVSGAAAYEGQMDLVSFDGDGFTVVMDDADPSQTEVFYMAIQTGAAGNQIIWFI